MIQLSQPIPEFGKFLESLRGFMSLREAAKRSGLSHAYIRDLELERNRSTNERITPSPDTLKKLSIAYSYPYTDLMIKAGHLKSEDVQNAEAFRAENAKIRLDEVLYIEIGRKAVTYRTREGAASVAVESLLDFSTFLDELEEKGFYKTDADVYANFRQIRKYDEARGKLYFDEAGKGPFVPLSSLRQKKYHTLIVRSVAVNTNSGLEFSFENCGTSHSLDKRWGTEA